MIFYNLDEKLVTVSGEFYEKSVLVMTGPFYNSFSIKKTERLEIASPFILDYQKRVLTYFLGQNGKKTAKKTQKSVEKINQKRRCHVCFDNETVYFSLNE